jgi:CheY-like chemotaxis protein
MAHSTGTSVAEAFRMTSVLVVDDDEELRTGMLRALSARGLDVHAVGGVDEAVGVLADRTIEVLVTDLRMAGRDGFELLEEASIVSPGTRPILMSAFATARDHQRATGFGAVAVLCKPFEPDELFAAVEQAIECETGFRGSVHGLSLVDILQMFHFSRRSVSVELLGGRPGKIHVDAGEIVHAEQEGLRGLDALEALLTQPSGALRTGVLETIERTIFGSFDSLLLNALRAIDESHSYSDNDLGAAFASWIPSMPPGPSSEGDATEALGRLLHGIEPYVRELMPHASAWLVSSEADAATVPVRAAEGTPCPSAWVRQIAVHLERLDPAWTSFENISETVGTGLFRSQELGCWVLVAAPLTHPRAKERFRSQFCALTRRARLSS